MLSCITGSSLKEGCGVACSLPFISSFSHCLETVSSSYRVAHKCPITILNDEIQYFINGILNMRVFA